MVDSIVIGAPTPVLLSGRARRWKQVSGPHTIDLSLMLPEFTDVVEFDVADDIQVHLNFGIIIKALFNCSLYPKLEDTQVFTINNVLINKSGNTLTLVGSVLEKLE